MIAGELHEARWGGVASKRRIGESPRKAGWPRPEPRRTTKGRRTPEPVLALAAAPVAEPLAGVGIRFTTGSGSQRFWFRRSQLQEERLGLLRLENIGVLASPHPEGFVECACALRVRTARLGILGVCQAALRLHSTGSIFLRHIVFLNFQVAVCSVVDARVLEPSEA